MYVVGVISDTHGRFRESLYAELAGCDHIIHAGDIGDPDILCTLESIAPTTAVLGNNDFPEYGDKVGRVATPTLAGFRFLVAHYPQDVDLAKGGRRALSAGDPLPRICIHGHTHVPRIVAGKEASPADLLMCPGAPFRPRSGSKPSIGKIEITPKGNISARIIEV